MHKLTLKSGHAINSLELFRIRKSFIGTAGTGVTGTGGMTRVTCIRKPIEKVFQQRPKFKSSFYLELMKMKLASFVLLTTVAGYSMAPGAFVLSKLLVTTVGTGLCVTSANSINQWTEIYYDAQMARTRNRVLVRYGLTSLHAFMFGIGSGLAGTAILSTVSPTVALLGFGNIILYTCVYTPMKRFSIYNTWPGAIPPVIGWVAQTGALDPGAILLGLTLYAWQFPHFNALSWNLRADYSKAGYRMMSVMDPAMNARVALRYSILLFPISAAFFHFDIASIWFLLDSSLVNGYMAFYAYKFYKESNSKNARTLFFASLVHLPVYLILLFAHKQTEEQNV